MTYKTLRHFRLSKGMRMIDLGEVIGYSSPHITNIELDQARPGVGFVEAFEKAYPGVKLERWGDASLKNGRGETQTTKGVLEEEAYQNLAIAIIEKAINDYKSCIRWSKWNEETVETMDGRMKMEDVYKLHDSCKAFFLGDWIKMLTTMDGEYILKSLEEQVGTISPRFRL